MSKSGKNTLQEYCQKEKIDLPSYESIAINGGWQACVKVKDFTASSSIKGKKVEAEIDAANKLLDIINEQHPPIRNIINPKNPKYIHLVDGENVIFEMPTQIRDDEAWYIFFYKYHARADREYPIEKILVECSRPDGVDSYMQLFAGVQISQNPNLELIFIHTRDKFGHSLADAIYDYSNGKITAEVV